MLFINAVVNDARRWFHELDATERLTTAYSDVRRDGVAIHVVLGVAVLLLILPVFIGAVASTQRTGIMTGLVDLIPGQYATENYRRALVDFNFGRFLLNSFLMSIVIVVGKLTLSLLAALAIVYYRVPYKNVVFMFILVTLMLPVPVRFVPLHNLVVNLGWSNTYWALTIPYLASATTVFILRQYFLTIPASIVETARVDGVGPIKFLVFVLIPMSKGVLVGVSVIMFVYAWNQYLWPIVIITRESMQVAQVGLGLLQGEAMAGDIAWSLIMAGSMMTLIPPLLLLIAFRKPLLETFTIQQK